MRSPASAFVEMSRTCQKISNRRSENKFSHLRVKLRSSIASFAKSFARPDGEIAFR